MAKIKYNKLPGTNKIEFEVSFRNCNGVEMKRRWFLVDEAAAKSLAVDGLNGEFIAARPLQVVKGLIGGV